LISTKNNGGTGGLHWVGRADGLPEDGVGPPDLLAQPPQRIPYRHLPSVALAARRSARTPARASPKP
jgi:hypothetical protein